MTDLQQKLEGYLGQECGPYLSWDAVNRPMIRHWCEAMGDTNPLYLDPEAARAHGFEGVVAPPTMLQAWTMVGFGDKRPPGSDTRDSFAVLGALEELGYPAVVAVNCEQEYMAYVEEGDQLYNTSRIVSISEEKSTALGVGFFVTEESRYFNQRDELVAVMLFRVFKYAAHEAAQPVAEADAAEAMPTARRMRPVRNEDTSFFWEGVDAGELRIQRCLACQTLRHPPAPACVECQSLEWDYVTSTGRGTLYSYVVMHYPEIPPFDYPNIVCLVELEEGTRVVSNLLGVNRQAATIGMPVEVEFREVEPGFHLHCFRPVE